MSSYHSNSNQNHRGGERSGGRHYGNNFGRGGNQNTSNYDYNNYMNNNNNNTIQAPRVPPQYNSNNTSTKQDYSQEWILAIQYAMQCLHSNTNNHGQNNTPLNDSIINTSIQYLNACEAQLLMKEKKWHLPPNFLPPAWDNSNSNSANNMNPYMQQHQQQQPVQQQQQVGYFPNYSSSYTGNSTAATMYQQQQPIASPLLSSTIAAATTTTGFNTKTSNRYGALFQDDDDDDDDDDEDDENVEDNDDDDDDEGGDQIVFQPQQQQQAGNNTKKKKESKVPYIYGMDMRRIMIRIYDAQSDCYAAQAILCRKVATPPLWNDGATKYTYCLHKIHSALLLADSEISKWISYAYNNTSSTNSNSNSNHNISMYMNQIVPLLVQDAEIVNIAVESMTKNRDEYIKAAKHSEEALLRKLEPQWSSRDEVKNKMGVDRWKNNPNPKNDYVGQRIQYEQELKDIRIALQCLSKLDTTSMVISAKQLHEKIILGQHGEQVLPSIQPILNMNNESNNNEQQQEDIHLQQYRYNGIRPIDTSRRVDIRMYPDPTVYGWTFTGSCEGSFVEFYEKSSNNSNNNNNTGNNDNNSNNNGTIIKLDWYYTTATMKTSMYHPRRNKKTQLFAAQVNPDVYINILQNPRTHTNQRYHTTTDNRQRQRTNRHNNDRASTDGGRGRGRGSNHDGTGNYQGRGGRGNYRGRGGRGDHRNNQTQNGDATS